MRKWKCVGITNKSGRFTVGKIYESDDLGLGLMSDSGFKFLDLSPDRFIHTKFEEIKVEDKKVKFRVGDRVKIVNKARNWDTVGKMDKWLGKIMTIREVGRDFARMEEDIKEGICEAGWVWNFECLELIESNNNSKSIHITFDNNITHAVLKDGKEVIKRAKVGLYHEDEYKFEVGVMEVVKKLLEIKEEKKEVVEGGNFSARCIRNDYDDCGLTIGKIYKFVDGYSKWDDGVKMPNFKDNEIERFRNIEDLEKWFGDADGYEFELVDEDEIIKEFKKDLSDYSTDELLDEIRLRSVR